MKDKNSYLEKILCKENWREKDKKDQSLKTNCLDLRNSFQEKKAKYFKWNINLITH